MCTIPLKQLVRKFDSTEISKDDLESILKETIVINRIRGENLFQAIKKYYIENKALFIELPHYEITLKEIDTNHLDLKLKLQWLKDLTFALDYLHLHLHSHKNINPNNVFVKHNRLILGQIGFTCEILSEANTNLEYYPLEFHESRELQMSSDVFSLGCLFYEILTSLKAFNSRDEIIQTKSVKRLINVNLDHIDEVIYQMLNHEKNNRPKIRTVLKFLSNLRLNNQ